MSSIYLLLINFTLQFCLRARLFAPWTYRRLSIKPPSINLPSTLFFLSFLSNPLPLLFSTFLFTTVFPLLFTLFYLLFTFLPFSSFLLAATLPLLPLPYSSSFSSTTPKITLLYFNVSSSIRRFSLSLCRAFLCYTLTPILLGLPLLYSYSFTLRSLLYYGFSFSFFFPLYCSLLLVFLFFKISSLFGFPLLSFFPFYVGSLLYCRFPLSLFLLLYCRVSSILQVFLN